MGHNVDLTYIGLQSVKCNRCGKNIDISEVDIDCDITPLAGEDGFMLNTQCNHCGHNHEATYMILEKHDSE